MGRKRRVTVTLLWTQPWRIPLLIITFQTSVLMNMKITRPFLKRVSAKIRNGRDAEINRPKLKPTWRCHASELRKRRRQRRRVATSSTSCPPEERSIWPMHTVVPPRDSSADQVSNTIRSVFKIESRLQQIFQEAEHSLRLSLPLSLVSTSLISLVWSLTTVVMLERQDLVHPVPDTTNLWEIQMMADLKWAVKATILPAVIKLQRVPVAQILAATLTNSEPASSTLNKRRVMPTMVTLRRCSARISTSTWKAQNSTWTNMTS